MFRKVIMSRSNAPEIAKVNRQSKVLYINSKIWDQLPTDQKDFVLFHEAGHLRLQTNNEFQANAYAVKKFAPAAHFNNKELGQRIIVMREILNKADEVNPGFSADLVAGATSGIFQTLAVLGVGSKARNAETQANIEAMKAAGAIKADSQKQLTKIVLILGVLVLVGTIIYLTLKKK